MSQKQLILYVIAAIIGVFLYNSWVQEYGSPWNSSSSVTSTATQATQAANGKSSEDTPYTPESYAPNSVTSDHVASVKAQPLTQGSYITVKTDVLSVQINSSGGDVVGVSLLKYPISLDQPDQFVQLLSPQSDKLAISQSGISSSQSTVKPIQFRAEQTSYQLGSDQKTLSVILTGQTADNLKVTKTYVFNRDDYAIHMTQKIENTGTNTWAGSVYQQITRRNYPVKTSTHVRSYTGAAYSSPDVPYKKLPFKTLDKTALSQNITGGWVAMQEPYFLTAWVPQSTKTFHYYSHVRPSTEGTQTENIYSLGYVSPQEQLAPGKSLTSTAQLFVGPELIPQLINVSPNLKYTIDYGWLSPISSFLFWLMKHIFSVVGNWGWTIVLVTLLLKMALYYPSAMSYRSMAAMRLLAPRLQALKERHGDDKQAMSKATMELYKKENVNPMGGCLPMLVQIPIFIALYWVLIESVQFRQAPFIFWIHDLSIKDPYYILPVLMGISMLVVQKMSPPPPDPTQAKMMLLMPVIFTVFFMSFPSGLVLYWLMNNCVSAAQQWYVMKTFDPEVLKKKKKKK